MNRIERVWERAFGWKRMREARETVRRFVPELQRARLVLDLGCGRGYTAQALRELGDVQVVGCDVVPDALHQLERYCLFDGYTLPFRDHTFDAVLLCFVLHHAKDPVGLLKEARRVSRGPVLAVEDTPTNWLDRGWGEVHERSFNRRNGIEWQGAVRDELEWRSLFSRAGLRVRRGERLGRWERLPPVCRTAFVLETRLPGP